MAHLKDSPLFNRSMAPSAINYRSSGRVISEDEIKRAMQKALRRDNVEFRSEE